MNRFPKTFPWRQAKTIADGDGIVLPAKIEIFKGNKK